MEHEQRHQIILKEFPLTKDQSDVRMDGMLSIQFSKDVLHRGFTVLVLYVNFIAFKVLQLSNTLNGKQNFIFNPLLFLVIRWRTFVVIIVLIFKVVIEIIVIIANFVVTSGLRNLTLVWLVVIDVWLELIKSFVLSYTHHLVKKEPKLRSIFK